MSDTKSELKDHVRSIFDRVSPNYDSPEMRYFPFSADYMMGLAKPKSGERVLDIATGTAMVAIAAAQYLRPEGRVQAIDISEGMLGKAKQNIDKHALENIDIHNMDAEQLDFRSDYFDLISCGFGLFFLADARQAVSKWHHVLKPGGRIIISTFNQSAFMPMVKWFRELIKETGVEFPASSWQQFSDYESCLGLFSDDLYQDKKITIKQHGIHLKDANEWWNIIINSGLRSYLQLLNPEQQAQLKIKHCQQLDELKTDDGIWMDVDVIYTQAIKRA